MHSIIKDIQYGLRNLLKRPGYTAIAFLTLALGLWGGHRTILLLCFLLFLFFFVACVGWSLSFFFLFVCVVRLGPPPHPQPTKTNKKKKKKTPVLSPQM